MQLLVLHHVTFFFSLHLLLAAEGKCRAAAIKAECAFQQPTLHVGTLTLHDFSSSDTAEWEGSILGLFSMLLPSQGTPQRIKHFKSKKLYGGKV